MLCPVRWSCFEAGIQRSGRRLPAAACICRPRTGGGRQEAGGSFLLQRALLLSFVRLCRVIDARSLQNSRHLPRGRTNARSQPIFFSEAVRARRATPCLSSGRRRAPSRRCRRHRRRLLHRPACSRHRPAPGCPAELKLALVASIVMLRRLLCCLAPRSKQHDKGAGNGASAAAAAAAAKALAGRPWCCVAPDVLGLQRLQFRCRNCPLYSALQMRPGHLQKRARWRAQPARTHPAPARPLLSFHLGCRASWPVARIPPRRP